MTFINTHGDPSIGKTAGPFALPLVNPLSFDFHRVVMMVMVPLGCNYDRRCRR
jgi:hypothetical protein